MTLTEALEKGRAWLLQNPTNKFCKMYGLKLHHLLPDKIHYSNPIMDGKEQKGYYIDIIRHPTGHKIKQTWKIMNDGKLILAGEKILSGSKGIKHQGKFIHASRLWKS